ncbi:hypothetical protein Tco_0858103, partial [Tanacetum coccineum]
TRPDFAYAVSRLIVIMDCIMTDILLLSRDTVMQIGYLTSGYVFTLGGAAISWKSSKQTVIAKSTMESEFIALDKCGEEAEWLRQFRSGVASKGIMGAQFLRALAEPASTYDHDGHDYEDFARPGRVLYPFVEIPSGEIKVHIEVLSVLWGNRLLIPYDSLPLSSLQKGRRNHRGREDLETLWKLVKAKHGSTRLEEGFKRVL